MANLPVVIFQFAMSPYEDWQLLTGPMDHLITGTVLGPSILAPHVYLQKGVDTSLAIPNRNQVVASASP